MSAWIVVWISKDRRFSLLICLFGQLEGLWLVGEIRKASPATNKILCINLKAKQIMDTYQSKTKSLGKESPKRVSRNKHASHLEDNRTLTAKQRTHQKIDDNRDKSNNSISLQMMKNDRSLSDSILSSPPVMQLAKFYDEDIDNVDDAYDFLRSDVRFASRLQGFVDRIGRDDFKAALKSLIDNNRQFPGAWATLSIVNAVEQFIRQNNINEFQLVESPRDRNPVNVDEWFNDHAWNINGAVRVFEYGTQCLGNYVHLTVTANFQGQMDVDRIINRIRKSESTHITIEEHGQNDRQNPRLFVSNMDFSRASVEQQQWLNENFEDILYQAVH